MARTGAEKLLHDLLWGLVIICVIVGGAAMAVIGLTLWLIWG